MAKKIVTEFTDGVGTTAGTVTITLGYAGLEGYGAALREELYKFGVQFKQVIDIDTDGHPEGRGVVNIDKGRAGSGFFKIID